MLGISGGVDSLAAALLDGSLIMLELTSKIL
jgi:NH3-dependent NAD+ synthetase